MKGIVNRSVAIYSVCFQPATPRPIGWEVYCTLIHHEEMYNDGVKCFLLNNIEHTAASEGPCVISTFFAIVQELYI